MARVRMPIGALNHFTAACGPDIFRGDRLPADLRGDLLFAEPVGRMIRRVKVVVTEGLTQLRNAYPNSEFILSTDPLFRPVNMMTAPDGTLYIVDMYHGIIQESEWTPPGSYLRKKIEQLQLDKVTSHGRIWRLVYDGIEPNRRQPRMLDERAGRSSSPISSIRTAGGATRRRSCSSCGRTSRSCRRCRRWRAIPTAVLGRFHAMWTLEGLGALDAALARDLLRDPNPLVRVQAIRASESLYKAGDKSFEADYPAAGEGSGYARHAPGDADAEPLEGPRHQHASIHVGAGREQGARRAGDRTQDSPAADERVRRGRRTRR